MICRPPGRGCLFRRETCTYARGGDYGVVAAVLMLSSHIRAAPSTAQAPFSCSAGDKALWHASGVVGIATKVCLSTASMLPNNRERSSSEENLFVSLSKKIKRWTPLLFKLNLINWTIWYFVTYFWRCNQIYRLIAGCDNVVKLSEAGIFPPVPAICWSFGTSVKSLPSYRPRNYDIFFAPVGIQWFPGWGQPEASNTTTTPQFWKWCNHCSNLSVFLSLFFFL